MKTDWQFVNTLEDNIHICGTLMKLINDHSQVEISNKVLDILCALCIGDWQSEPHQQHWNPVECHYQTIEAVANTIFDCTSSLAYLWLLCLMYICFILNHMASKALNNFIPIQVLTGSTPDISPLLQFQWYEPIYLLQG